MLLFLVLASVLGVWSAVVMSTLGDGTPLPSAMPNRLVIAGPYRWIRNPMAVAGIVQGTAIGLILQSWLVIAYAVVGSLVWNYAVRPLEESDLKERFGEEFQQYRDTVRCWIPKTPKTRAPEISRTLLVVDDREAPASQVGEAISHGLQLIRRVSNPIHEFTDDLHRFPGPIRPAFSPGKLLIRHIGVVFKGARRFHDVDPPTAFACGEFGPPRCGIQGCRRVHVIRCPSFLKVRATSWHQQVPHRQLRLRPVKQGPQPGGTSNGLGSFVMHTPYELDSK